MSDTHSRAAQLQALLARRDKFLTALQVITLVLLLVMASIALYAAVSVEHLSRTLDERARIVADLRDVELHDSCVGDWQAHITGELAELVADREAGTDPAAIAAAAHRIAASRPSCPDPPKGP